MPESSDIRPDASLARQGRRANGERLALESLLLRAVLVERFWSLTAVRAVPSLRMPAAARSRPASRGVEPFVRSSQRVLEYRIARSTGAHPLRVGGPAYVSPL